MDCGQCAVAVGDGCDSRQWAVDVSCGPALALWLWSLAMDHGHVPSGCFQTVASAIVTNWTQNNILIRGPGASEAPPVLSGP